MFPYFKCLMPYILMEYKLECVVQLRNRNLENNDEFVYLFIVGFLWGATNPFLKKGSVGIGQVQADSLIIKFALEIKFLISNWKYVLPYLVNQSGSLLYFFTLRSASLTLAVPIANSIALVVTAVTGWFLGESTPKLRSLAGSALILLGTVCYILDKS